ncbi:Wzz/FepE/Etk N-terminal domain-containing protein [Patiriisocius sp. Uisw_017]|jgi:uncharacterized protein involved in exopolysaccharide biosynthesis|uniref:Wzz/FepE/Etk N-terminal domain-containing protein n=1 Tax=Patiriisocius sp. Uisw_017 TaxID=3230968 RepID=UPI0039EC2F6C
MDSIIKVSDSKVKSYTISTAVNAILNKRRLILAAVILFFVIGVIIAVISPKNYTSSSIVLPQISSSKGLSKKYTNIASLVGINLGQSEGNKIVPSLYPLILDNLTFQRKLLNQKIEVSGEDGLITYAEYLSLYESGKAIDIFKSYTIGLPGKFMNMFKTKDKFGESTFNDSTIFKITPIEKSQISSMKSQINISFNELDGYIDISATTLQPIVSAQLVKKCEHILEEAIINYNIEKSRNELDFISKRYEMAEKEYVVKRANLGSYRDSNKYSISYITKSRDEQLKNERDLAYEIFSQLANQVESAKLQVAKDTPIFTLLKAPYVSLEASSLAGAYIVLIFIFVGFIVGVCYVLLISLIPYLKANLL